MPTPQHTPGPWIISGPSPTRPTYDDGGDYAILADGAIIAEAYRRVGRIRVEPVEANARLIAAAPELLEALNELVAELDNPDLHDQIETGGMLLARQAITKAEGVQP